jgi:hypothetical protein
MVAPTLMERKHGIFTTRRREKKYDHLTGTYMSLTINPMGYCIGQKLMNTILMPIQMKPLF